MEKISKFTLGVDLGDRRSVICVIDASGDVTEQSKAITNKKAFKRISIIMLDLQ